MKTVKTATWISALLAVLLLAGCATRTVVVPAHQHAHYHGAHHVVYKVRPAKAHCWRHRGHWDCRKS